MEQDPLQQTPVAGQRGDGHEQTHYVPPEHEEKLFFFFFFVTESD